MRTAAGRNPDPTAGVIDAQSIKPSTNVPATSQGYDAGKKIAGRKRSIITDTLGLLLAVLVTAAGASDSAAGLPLLATVATAQPTLTKAWADSAYRTTVIEGAAALGIDLEVVTRDPATRGFAPLPRRWVAERTLGWLMRALRRMDVLTGKVEIIDVPCGATLESKCPPCAKRNRQLRMAQCREGWHLDHEPINTPDEANDEQRWLVEFRADIQARRDEAEQLGQDTGDLDAVIVGLDEEINEAGMRGNVLGRVVPKRSRSTKRRQDAPDLPKRKMADTTLGRTFAASDGRVYRPSLFVTLTLPSYGRVRDGVPVDPATYDYARAARDALHFSKLVDRFVQNLRRVAGYDVQYFATVEPQKRLAPHLHMAIRGTLPRAEIKQIAAATYHQVWWPSVDTVKYEGDHLPVWEEGAGYLDPHTGEVLPTWGEALDELDADEGAEPLHVIRFGDQVDVKGVLAGTSDADQCIRYLSKYLTKSLGQSLDGEAQREHAARFVDALRYEPCSPACPNWLR
ncbi:replication initiator [Nonomuraea wenchangensis]|uniref:replication initiator n=1 Tax=Nonomuraea wenchangensis TaxID=568860 RepID=UPI0034276DAD